MLQKLEERGAALRLDSPEGTRYLPVSPQELFTRLKQQYEAALETASSALCEIAAPAGREQILNVQGYAALLDHARALLDRARERLLLSTWPEEALALAEPVSRSIERGVQVTTLCLRGCSQPCPACRGEIFRYPIAPVNAGRWLVLVPDDKELLAGEISPQGDALAVRTRQKMLVNLSASYIQNSIALAGILSSLGSRLETLLDPGTMAALQALHPLHTQGQWLDTMRQMLQAADRTSTN